LARGLAVAAQTDDPGLGLKWLGESEPRIVGVTLGSDGFAWPDGAVERPAPPYPVHALDTLAACDGSHGAFTSTLPEGNDIAHSAGFANRAAAIKCSLRWSQRRARRAEVYPAMNSLKSNS
jgi:sugar/nucleoside kinase (ribokinase family)